MYSKDTQYWIVAHIVVWCCVVGTSCKSMQNVNHALVFAYLLATLLMLLHDMLSVFVCVMLPAFTLCSARYPYQ